MRKIYLFISLMAIAWASHQLAFAKRIPDKKVFAPIGQNITFNPIATQNYGAADLAPGATASSGLAVTYTSSNTSVATIVSGKIHVVGVGTSVITASQAGDGVNYNSAVDVTQLLTVNPVITFPALGTKTFTTTNVAPGATSNYAGTPITYTTSDPTVASIVPNQIHYAGLGTATITATQAGVGNSAASYTPVTVSSVLTVAKGVAPVITFGALGSKPLQTIDLAPGATSTYDPNIYPITYSIDPASPNPAAATIVNNRIHFVSLGTVNIIATQANFPNFNDAVQKTSTLTITAPVITFTTLPANKTVTSVDFDPAATSTLTGVQITYTSDNPLVATIVNNKVHYVGGLGVANITASQANGAASPAPVIRALTVNAAPGITFAATATKALTTPDYDPAATSTITNALITYSVPANQTVASIVNNKLHLTGLGTVQVTASQGGVITPDVVQTLTVAPSAPAITLAATASKVYSTTDFDYVPATSPTVTSTIPVANYPITFTSSNPNVATIVQNKLHYVGTGVTTITASQLGATSVTQQLTVTAPTITFAALGTKPFNQADLDPAATSPITTIPITYTSSNNSVATIVSNKIHYVGVGTTNITASQGNVVVPDVTLALTVSQPAITFAALGTKPFSVTDIDPGATSTLVNVPIVYTSSDPTVATIVNNKIHFVAPGTAQITASQAGSGTSAYNAPPDVTSILTVAAQPLITFPATALGTKPYTSTDIPAATLNATSTLTSGNSPILYTSSDPTVATIVNNAVHYVGVGTTIITANQAALPPATQALGQSQQLVVTPAAITFNAIAVKPLGSADFAAGATSTIATTIAPITYTSSDTTVATIVGANIHLIGAGRATITASQNVTGNYAPAPVTQVLVVIPATITFPVLGSKAQSITDVSPGATSTAPVAANPIVYTSSDPTVATIVNNLIHYIGPGTTTITASQGGVVAADVSQILTVTPAAITFPPLGPKPFSLTDLAPGATSSVSAPAITYSSSNTAVATIVANAIHYVGLGTTIITASQGGVVTADVSQPLTVLPPTIIFPTALGSKAYSSTDLANPGATSTLSVALVPIVYTSSNPAVATIINGGIHYVGPGQTVITASQPADPNNAYPAPNSAISVLTVTSPTITLATSAFLPFSNTDATPTATSTTAVPAISYTSSNPAVVTIVNGKYHFTGFGNTIITASQVDPNNPGNPTPAAAIQLLTVYQGNEVLTFSAFPATVKYGTADFAPTSTSTGDPIVFSSNDPTIATIVNGKVHLVGVGTAVITATLNPTSGNFVGSSTLSQTLNVVIGTQTITDVRIPTLIIGRPAYPVSSVASSGLPLTIFVADSSIASVNGLNITPLKFGSTIVNIVQPGNTLFLPDTISEVVNVMHAPGADVVVSKVLSPNSDGINDFLYIYGAELYSTNHMTIMKRNGVKVYEANNYNNQGTVFTGKSTSGNDYLPSGTYFYRFDYPLGSGKSYTSGYFVLKY